VGEEEEEEEHDDDDDDNIVGSIVDNNEDDGGKDEYGKIEFSSNFLSSDEKELLFFISVYININIYNNKFSEKHIH
jgi:hypothetical protein